MKSLLFGDWRTKLTALVLAALVFWYLRVSGAEERTFTVAFQVQAPETVARTQVQILGKSGNWLPLENTIQIILHGSRGDLESAVADDIRCRIQLTAEHVAMGGEGERMFELSPLNLAGIRAGRFFDVEFIPSSRVRVTWVPFERRNMRIATTPIPKIVEGKATGMQVVRVTAMPESVEVLLPKGYSNAELILPPPEVGRLPVIYPQPVSVAGRAVSFDAVGRLHAILEADGVRLVTPFTLRVELQAEAGSREIDAQIGEMRHPGAFAVRKWRLNPPDDTLRIRVTGPKTAVDRLDATQVKVHLLLTAAPIGDQQAITSFSFELPEGFRDLRVEVIETPPHVTVEFLP